MYDFRLASSGKRTLSACVYPRSRPGEILDPIESSKIPGTVSFNDIKALLILANPSAVVTRRRNTTCSTAGIENILENQIFITVYDLFQIQPIMLT
jgi:hypothetical protein